MKPDVDTLLREGHEHHAKMTGHDTPGGPGWRAGAFDKVRLFFPDPNSLAGPYGESCLLKANEHFPNYSADLAGIAWMRNHLPILLEAIEGLRAELAAANTAGALAQAHATNRGATLRFRNENKAAVIAVLNSGGANLPEDADVPLIVHTIGEVVRERDRLKAACDKPRSPLCDD